MRISARCGYACRALLELSLHWPDKEPLSGRHISSKQKIPLRYLVHILIQLKRMGIVSSSRGKAGGYNLARDPKDISLGELMRTMGGTLLPVAPFAVIEGSVFSEIWNEVEGSIANVLDGMNFDDISRKAKGLDSTIIYQI